MLAGAAGGIAVTGAAVDLRAAVVGDFAAFAVADLRPGVSLTVPFLCGVLAPPFGPLVRLLTLLAAVLGVRGVGITQERSQAAQQRQAGEEAEQSPAGASLGQRPRQGIKT